MYQWRAKALGTLKLTALAGNKGGEELSVGQSARGTNSILWERAHDLEVIEDGEES